MHTAPVGQASQDLNAQDLIAIVAAGQKENERGDGLMEMERLRKLQKSGESGGKNQDAGKPKAWQKSVVEKEEMEMQKAAVDF